MTNRSGSRIFATPGDPIRAIVLEHVLFLHTFTTPPILVRMESEKERRIQQALLDASTGKY